MSQLGFLLFILVVLLVVLAIWAVIGHLLWEMAAWTICHVVGQPEQQALPTTQPDWECISCNSVHPYSQIRCGHCGITRPTPAELEQIKDFAASQRQLIRFRDSNKIEIADLEKLQTALIEARQDLIARKRRPTATHVPPETAANSSRVPPPTTTIKERPPVPANVAEPKPTIVKQPRPPRRPFSEVLNTFMEQSNIRWGEIIGGLLIIGCSTALTVSRWAEISQIPVLEFLIFTT